ncbi:MAG: hypothetical protein KF878_19645 [Planctomycetes bacterium]|nr:hypothetical protein [Planctomycetota bacterium]
MAAVMLLAALAAPAAAQDTVVKAWLGRTVAPNAGEQASFYLWGATRFVVDEYRIAAEDVEASIREGGIVVDRARLRPRRTVTFQGEQGALALPNLPGVYVHVARATAGQPSEQAQAVVVTRLGLAVKRDDARSLALVHDDERPAQGVRVAVLETRGDAAPRLLGASTTDALGLARASTSPTGALTFVARSGTSVAIQQTWDRSWSAQPRWVAHLSTDRPLYRPGQVVHWRAVLREQLGGASASYRTPQDEEVRLFLRDARGQRLTLGAQRTSAFGTASGSYTLPAGASLGEWGLELEAGPAGPHTGSVAWSAFGVEAYRKPEFKVTVTPGAAALVQGQQGSATIAAEYYFGAPVAGAKARWTVSKRPRWRWWNPWLEPMVMRCIWRPEPTAEVVAQGEVTLGPDGTARVRFATTRDGEDADYEVSAEVTDASDRMVAGAGSLAVNRAAFDLQVLSDRSVYRPDDVAQVRVSTARADGAPVSGVPVALRIEAVDPQGNRELRVSRTLVTGTDGTAGLRLLVRTRAQFVITATALDGGANRVTSERTLWVHDDRGGVDWSWQAVSVTADKEAYAPGETALLLVRAPVRQGRGLVTLESRGMHSAYSFPIVHGLGLVAVRVTADMAPNVFASVLVPTRDGVQQADKELIVPPLDALVEVTITADRPEYRPGDRGTFLVKTTDRLGRPVEADVALGIVDEALYGLREDQAPALRETFYPRGGNQVTTVGAMGGGFWGPMVLKSGVAEMSADAGKTDGGQPREHFVDTLRFVGSVVTDLRGEATLTETFADNLTTWRLTARAVTRGAQVGETKTTTLVRKDLIVRLAAPRTLVEGDEMTLAAVVHNLAKDGAAGADPARVTVRLAAQGVTVLGAASRTVTVPRGGHARVTWPVRVESAAAAVLEARADAPFDQDALRLTLPVAARGAPRREAQAGSLLRDGRATLRLTKDARAIDAGTALELSLAPSLAGTMLESLDYLVGYPYGCVEQIMSKFLPDVVVAEVLRTIGREDPALAAELPKMVKVGVEQLQGMQNADGGFGWFASNESHPFVSAYVLYGLALARRGGFDVPAPMLEQAAAFLEHRLDRRLDGLDGRAYQTYALATAGRLRTADLRDLARQRARLNDYARGVLVLSLAAAGEQALARDVLADLDRSAVQSAGRCHWVGDTVQYGQWMNNPVETTAYVARAYLAAAPQSDKVPAAISWLLDRRQASGQYTTTKDTAAVVMTLAEHVRATGELDPDMAVTVQVNGQQVFSGRFAPADVAKPARAITVPGSALRAGVNTVVVERQGRGALYHAAVLRQVVRQDPLLAEDQGLRVRRSYSVVETSVDPATRQVVETERPLVGGRVRQGERVRVRLSLTVSRPGAVEHVNLEDRFPVGFEVVTDDAASRWSWWSSAREVHDDRVVFFATHLPLRHPETGAPTFEYTYDLRAEVAGRFTALPTFAEAVYAPDTHGRGDGATIVVERP